MPAVGFETVGKKAGSALKGALEEETGVKEDIRERDVTKTVSPRQKQEREDSDRKALAARMRRIRSDDSLRSIDTVIWHTESSSNAGQAEEDKTQVGSDVEDEDIYSDEEAAELALTLSPISAPRNLKHAMLELSSLFCPADFEVESHPGNSVEAKTSRRRKMVASA